MSKKTFDISKLRGTSLSAIKEQNEEISFSGSKKNYLSISEGTNKFRFFPAHPDSHAKDFYAQRKHVAWLPFKNDDGDIKNRSFLNARIHASQPKDIIEEFISIAAQVIPKNKKLSTKAKGDKLDAMSDFKKGIKFQSKFMAYAVDESGERGLLEFSNGIKKKLDVHSMSEDDPTAPDAISDPSEGFQVVIKYDKKKDNNNKYVVTLARKPSEISQEDGEWWINEDSISEILDWSDRYHKGVFDNALNSLRLYDEENALGVFGSDEFQEAAEDLRALLPEKPESDGDSDGDYEEDEEDDSVSFGEMTRKELKAFKVEADLKVKITRQKTDDALLEEILDEIGLSEDNYPSDFFNSKEDDELEEDDELDEEEDDLEGEAKEANDKAKERASKIADVEEEDEDEDPLEEEQEEEKPKERRARRERRGR